MTCISLLHSTNQPTRTTHPPPHTPTRPPATSPSPPPPPQAPTLLLCLFIFWIIEKLSPLHNPSAIWTVFLLSITQGCCKLNSLGTLFYSFLGKSGLVFHELKPLILNAIADVVELGPRQRKCLERYRRGPCFLWVEMSELLLKVIICQSLWGK